MNGIFRIGAVVLACATVVGALAGCAPLLLGGAAVGGVLVATDRRTSGTQLEDESIELKAGRRVGEVFGDSGHVNVTSYNRTVLVTGEAPNEAGAEALRKSISEIENVRAVVNELAVMGSSSITSRSNDTIITSKVKASFVDAKDVQANAIKVVTERATVYLMGRVTEREASRAVDIARGVGGVAKVIRVFEILTEAELASQALPSK